MSKLLVPTTAAPAVIGGAVRSVLEARGYYVVRVANCILGDHERTMAVKLTDEQLADLLRDVGNNATQALTSIDENPENA